MECYGLTSCNLYYPSNVPPPLSFCFFFYGFFFLVVSQRCQFKCGSIGGMTYHYTRCSGVCCSTPPLCPPTTPYFLSSLLSKFSTSFSFVLFLYLFSLTFFFPIASSSFKIPSLFCLSHLLTCAYTPTCSVVITVLMFSLLKCRCTCVLLVYM